MVADQTCPDQEADERDHSEDIEREPGNEVGLGLGEALQRKGDLIVPGIVGIVAPVVPS